MPAFGAEEARLNAVFDDELFITFPAEPAVFSRGQVLPSRTHGVNWSTRGITGLIDPDTLVPFVPRDHELVLIQREGVSKAALSVYINSMDSNVGPLSELVVSLPVSPTSAGSIRPFVWRNPYSVAMPVLAGAKTWLFKIVLSAEQQAAEVIHRVTRGWDATRGKLDFHLAASPAVASACDAHDQSIVRAQVGAVTGWNVFLDLLAFYKALRSARLPFPKRQVVNEIPIVNADVEGGSTPRETTMFIKGSLRYRRFASSGDRIEFGTGSELGAFLARLNFEPQIVTFGNALKIVTTASPAAYL